MKITQAHLYFAKRLGYIVVTLFVISVIVFMATVMLPGSAARLILGRQASPEKVEQLEQQMGLDQPPHVQYLDWLTNLLSGDAGTSLMFNEPVVGLVLPRAHVSLQLAVITLVVVSFIGIPLAVLSAVRKDTMLDRTISSLTYVGISLPEFVTGTLLVLLLAGPVFNVLPGSEYVSIYEGVVPWITHMILPVTTLTIILTAYVLRQTRSELIEVLKSEYVRTAKLKGLSKRKVLFKHALRNGLLPTITIMALNFGWLMGGLVVVEEVFNIPGLGRLVVTAIQNRDIPVLQFAVLVIATIYTLSNTVADLLYSYLDPRISYGGGE